MSSIDLVMAVVDNLNQLQISYMMVGSFSSNYYGMPRSTQDADFLIQVSGAQISQLSSRLAPAIVIDPQMSFETITGTWRYVGHASLSAFKIEFFLVSSDGHDLSRFERRRVVTMDGHDVYMPSPEDVVVTKLRWSQRGKRRKDLDDIRNVLSVQKSLDWPYIEHWCGQHGTRELLDQLKASLPADL